ncbi:MAG: RHS repeat domain-containing protein [Mangrovibacterium sp.]
MQTNNKERSHLWDEEHRLRAICDNGYVSSYFDDAAGERTVKMHGASEGIHVNSAFSGGFTNNQNYTLYVNPYLVLQQGGQYTKHIYIGSQRIVSKLGDVGSFGVDPRREEYAGASVSGTSVPDYANKYKALQEVIKQNYATFEIDYYGANNDDYVNGAGFCCGESMQSKSIPTTGDTYEKLQYYYHADHLGSASYITNLDGEVVQHVEYVPLGEVFIEERNNTWNTPFLFNGKEYDSETGLYYYGARYYNARISLWYGVDPLAEKYPGVSAYAYCVNNPVKLIDEEGEAPAIPIVAVAAIDVLLIATGVVATGIFIHKAADGSFALNENINIFHKDNPGYREQQRREGKSRAEDAKIARDHSESLDRNIGEPSPDGTPDPKGDIGIVGKVAIGVGLVAEAGKGIYENTITSNTSQEASTDTSNENRTSSQPIIKNTDVKDINIESNLLVPTWSPFPQKENQQIQIPLR